MIGVWRMRRTEGGKRYAHRLLLRLPGIAGIYRPLIVGHMTRTLGMLLKNGVTLLKALHIVKSVADNKLMAQAVQNMIDGVQAGRDLSEFMNDPLVFPPLSRQMVAAGERSGQARRNAALGRQRQRKPGRLASRSSRPSWNRL